MRPVHLLSLAIAASFLAVGIPYWLTPYDKLNLPSGLMGPGLLVVAIAALVLRSGRIISFWRTTWLVGLAVPMAVMTRVVVDVARDPTSHNLWPLELVIAVIVGGACALPGAVVGTVFATRR
jgi:hypothetical protein